MPAQLVAEAEISLRVHNNILVYIHTRTNTLEYIRRTSGVPWKVGRGGCLGIERHPLRARALTAPKRICL